MPINVVDGFNISSALPLDLRTVYNTVEEALVSIHEYQRYDGLTVWIKSLQKSYRFVGGTDNSNFQEVKTGSTGGAGVKYFEYSFTEQDFDEQSKLLSIKSTQHGLGNKIIVGYVQKNIDSKWCDVLYDYCVQDGNIILDLGIPSSGRVLLFSVEGGN